MEYDDKFQKKVMKKAPTHKPIPHRQDPSALGGGSISAGGVGGFHKQQGAYYFPNGEVFRPRNATSAVPPKRLQVCEVVDPVAATPELARQPPQTQLPPPAPPQAPQPMYQVLLPPPLLLLRTHSAGTDIPRSQSLQSFTSPMCLVKSNSVNNMKKFNLVQSLRASTNDTPTNINMNMPPVARATKAAAPYQSTNIVRSQSVVSFDDHHLVNTHVSSDSNPSSLLNYNLNRSSSNTPTTSINNSIDEGVVVTGPPPCVPPQGGHIHTIDEHKALATTIEGKAKRESTTSDEEYTTPSSSPKRQELRRQPQPPRPHSNMGQYLDYQKENFNELLNDDQEEVPPRGDVAVLGDKVRKHERNSSSLSSFNDILVKRDEEKSMYSDNTLTKDTHDGLVAPDYSGKLTTASQTEDESPNDLFNGFPVITPNTSRWPEPISTDISVAAVETPVPSPDIDAATPDLQPILNDEKSMKLKLLPPVPQNKADENLDTESTTIEASDEILEPKDDLRALLTDPSFVTARNSLLGPPPSIGASSPIPTRSSSPTHSLTASNFPSRGGGNRMSDPTLPESVYCSSTESYGNPHNISSNGSNELASIQAMKSIPPTPRRGSRLVETEEVLHEVETDVPEEVDQARHLRTEEGALMPAPRREPMSSKFKPTPPTPPHTIPRSLVGNTSLDSPVVISSNEHPSPTVKSVTSDKATLIPSGADEVMLSSTMIDTLAPVPGQQLRPPQIKSMLGDVRPRTQSSQSAHPTPLLAQSSRLKTSRSSPDLKNTRHIGHGNLLSGHLTLLTPLPMEHLPNGLKGLFKRMFKRGDESAGSKSPDKSKNTSANSSFVNHASSGVTSFSTLLKGSKSSNNIAAMNEPTRRKNNGFPFMRLNHSTSDFAKLRQSQNLPLKTAALNSQQGSSKGSPVKITLMGMTAEPLLSEDLTLTKLPTIEQDTDIFGDMLTSFDERFNRSSVYGTKASINNPFLKDDELTADQIEDQRVKDAKESLEDLVNDLKENASLDSERRRKNAERLGHSRSSSDEVYVDDNILFLQNEVQWLNLLKAITTQDADDDEYIDIVYNDEQGHKVLIRRPKAFVQSSFYLFPDDETETIQIDNEQLNNLFSNLSETQRRQLPMHLKYIKQFRDFDNLEITIKTGRKRIMKGMQPAKPLLRRFQYPNNIKRKSVMFGNKIYVNETYAPEMYKRYNKGVTQYTLTEAHEINRIKTELNQYKCNEMLVHEQSQNNTHFFY